MALSMKKPDDVTADDMPAATPEPVKPAGSKLIPILLNSDYWAHENVKDQWPYPDDNRIKAGVVINLPGDEARRLMREGKGERADPLPDEG